MTNDTKRPAPARPTKKTEKKEALRHLPDVPTAEQIERSIAKGVKL
jgi:hypothetical protein